MLNTTSFRLPAILLLSATALLANNVSGEWSGTAGNGKDNAPLSFVLYQNGDRITGIARIKDNLTVEGVVKGDQVVLDTTMGNDKIRFQLSLSGTQLYGTGWVVGSNGSKRDVATVTLTLAHAGKSNAGLNGTWLATAETFENGKSSHESFTFQLDRNGSIVTGVFTDKSGKTARLSNGVISGNEIVLAFTIDDVSVRFQLTLSGNQLTGTAVAEHGTEKRSAKITAVKQS